MNLSEFYDDKWEPAFYETSDNENVTGCVDFVIPA